MIKIQNKTALIIGGTGGIGTTITKQLINKGLKVCATYYNEEDKNKIDQNKLINLELHQMNVRNEETIKKSISLILESHKKIDAVIYCVSSPIINKNIHDMEWKDFQEHIEIQIKGLFEIIKNLFPLIKECHKIKFIVILTEYCIGKPPIMLSHYITAKYGLMGFTKCMASELIKNNCTFNMVSPGMVNTKLLSDLPPKLIELTAYKNPMKRIAEPEDIAKVVSFLILEDADYLNGVNIPINGGNIFI